MIFSYSLVLGLFLLAPGLGTYAGVYFGAHRGAYRPGAPAPASVLTLGIIVLGSLFAHMVWALVCVANDLWAAAGLFTIFPAIPSAYAVLFAGAVGQGSLGNAGVAVFLTTSGLLTGAAFLVTSRLVQSARLRPIYLRLVYGWLVELVEAPGDERLITAFVVTDMEHDNLRLGYEGSVLSLVVNADKQITALVLGEAVTFYLKMDAAAVTHVPISREIPLAKIYLEQREIKNVAFRIYEFED